MKNGELAAARSLNTGAPVRRELSAYSLIAIVIAIVVVWVHWPSLSTGAYCFDDQDYFINNPLVKSPGLDSAGRFFAEVFEPSTVRGYYQALTMVSLMLDAAMGGSADNLRPFHCTSLALHVANTLLLFVLMLQLFGCPWAAGLAALAFGVHPLTVEPIAWVSERKTLLATFFALASLVCYVRYTRARGRMAYAGVVVAYLLALLSKPTSLPLPVMMLLLDFWPLQRSGRRIVIEKLPLFAVGATSAFVTYQSQARTFGVELPGAHSWTEIPLRFLYDAAFYPLKIIFPLELSPHYPVPAAMDLAQPMVLAGVIVTVLLVVAIVRSLRHTRAIACGAAIFFVGLLPTMQVVGFSDVIASDKFVYLPAVGLVMVLSWAIGKLVAPSSHNQGRRALPVLGAAVLVIALEATALRRQLEYWGDTKALFAHMLSIAPNSDLVHLGLGMALKNKGETSEAETHLREAIHLQPNRAASHAELGNLLSAQHQYDAAIAAYRESIRIEPNQATIHLNLGINLALAGRHEEAIYSYREAIRLRPEYAKAHQLLAGLLLQAGDPAEAAKEALIAARLEPEDASVLFDTAVILSKTSHASEAERLYREALRLEPGRSDARNNLAVLLAQAGRYPEAEVLLRDGLAIHEDDASLHNNLGIVLDSTDRSEEAASEFEHAIQLAPNFADPHYNLAAILADQHKIAEAMRHYHEVLRIAPDHTRARQRLTQLEQLRPDTPND